MTLLLDTDVLIDHIQKGKTLSKSSLGHPLALSVITYGEALYGIKKSYTPADNEKKFIVSLQKLNATILDVTQDIIVIFTDLRYSLEKQGNKLDEFDLLIAATAIHYGYPLVTRNKKHFLRIPGLILAD